VAEATPSPAASPCATSSPYSSASDVTAKAIAESILGHALDCPRKAGNDISANVRCWHRRDRDRNKVAFLRLEDADDLIEGQLSVAFVESHSMILARRWGRSRAG
jgi:hypothetical protein